ncbi:UNVERIFIED_CONTAM: hypothetical protein RMT77_017610 [Armadillidium vulgare]
MFSSYTKRQWFIFVLFAIVYGMAGVCMYIQAPFYPKIASEIGASAFQYSSVFSVFYFVAIIMGPITVKLMILVDPYVIAKTAIFILGTTNILFGFINSMYDIEVFLTFSLLIRMFESFGYTTFIVTTFSIIAEEFFDDIATVMACLESCLGLGLIIGPGIGGVLYEYGGFTIPFLVTGLMILFIGVFTLFIESSKRDSYLTIKYKDACSLITKPECILAIWSLCGVSFTVGFIDATLSSHLNHLNLSESMKSLFFGIIGLFYCLFCPLCGRLLDSGRSPHIVWSFGAILICISLLLLGPAPYFNISLSIPLCCTSLILLGIGFSCQYVSSLLCFHKITVYLGFPDDITTYGMVSGLFSTCTSFGGMIGPLVGGFLYDTIGVPWGLHVVIFLNILLLLCTIFYSYSPSSIFVDLITVKRQESDLLLK